MHRYSVPASLKHINSSFITITTNTTKFECENNMVSKLRDNNKLRKSHKVHEATHSSLDPDPSIDYY